MATAVDFCHCLRRNLLFYVAKAVSFYANGFLPLPAYVGCGPACVLPAMVDGIMALDANLAAVVKKMNVEFTLKGSVITADEMLSPKGLLPGIAKRADQLASLCLGYGLGMKAEDEDGALLGVRVSFDEFTPDVIRLFCLVDVIQELVKLSPNPHSVPLDELMYD